MAFFCLNQRDIQNKHRLVDQVQYSLRNKNIYNGYQIQEQFYTPKQQLNQQWHQDQHIPKIQQLKLPRDGQFLQIQHPINLSEQCQNNNEQSQQLPPYFLKNLSQSQMEYQYLKKREEKIKQFNSNYNQLYGILSSKYENGKNKILAHQDKASLYQKINSMIANSQKVSSRTQRKPIYLPSLGNNKQNFQQQIYPNLIGKRNFQKLLFPSSSIFNPNFFNEQEKELNAINDKNKRIKVILQANNLIQKLLLKQQQKKEEETIDDDESDWEQYLQETKDKLKRKKMRLRKEKNKTKIPNILSNQQQKVQNIVESVSKIEKNNEKQKEQQLKGIEQTKIQMKLKKIFYVVLFIQILKGEATRMSNQRKQISQILVDKYAIALNDGLSLLLINLIQPLKIAIENKGKSLMLFGKEKGFGTTEVNESEVNKRTQLLQTYISQIFEQMIKFDSQYLTPLLKNYLNQLTLNCNYLPSNIITNPILQRLNFTIYGGLQNLTPFQKNILLIDFFYCKVLIGEILFNFSQHLLVQQNDINNQNTKTISSIIYRIIMKYITNISRDSNNQNHLNPLIKIKSRPPIENRLMDSEFEKEQGKIEVQNPINEIIIKSMYSEKLLQPIFKQQLWIDKQIENINDFLNKMQSFIYFNNKQ